MSVLLAQLLRIAANCPDVRQAGPLMEKAADRIEKYRRELNTRTFLMGEDGRMMASLLERKQELETERDALRAELAEVKGREAVPVAWHTEDHLEDKSATTYSKEVAERWRSKGWPIWPLYASQPASPDVDGLVNELQRIAEKCSDPDTTDALDTALSTWRQAQEGKP